jgi:hypothetical protein
VGFGLGLVLLVTGAILVARVPNELLGVEGRTYGMVLLVLGVVAIALSVRFRSSFGSAFSVGRRRD